MYEVLTWSDFHNSSIEMARAFEDQVDVVVGILRGGYFPAHVVADFLGVDVLVMRLKSYTGIAKRDKVKIKLPLIGDIEDKNVLLVDDVCDSGKTLEVAKSLLSFYSPRSIKTATLYIKPSCSSKPDFWVKETDKWVVFPWDLFETLRNDPSASWIKDVLGVRA